MFIHSNDCSKDADISAVGSSQTHLLILCVDTKASILLIHSSCVICRNIVLMTMGIFNYSGVQLSFGNTFIWISYAISILPRLKLLKETTTKSPLFSTYYSKCFSRQVGKFTNIHQTTRWDPNCETSSSVTGWSWCWDEGELHMENGGFHPNSIFPQILSTKMY